MMYPFGRWSWVEVIAGAVNDRGCAMTMICVASGGAFLLWVVVR